MCVLYLCVHVRVGVCGMHLTGCVEFANLLLCSEFQALESVKVY